MQYETADNLAVLPENAASAVSALAGAQGYSLGQVIRLKAAAGVSDFKHPFPTPCTVGEALTRYYDIQVGIDEYVLHYEILFCFVYREHFFKPHPVPFFERFLDPFLEPFFQPYFQPFFSLFPSLFLKPFVSPISAFS